MRQFLKQKQPAKNASVPSAWLRSVAPERARAPDQGISRTTAPPLGFDFSRIPVHGKTPVGIQTKLTIGAAGDAFEQEADRVAEQVMSVAPQRATFPALASPSGLGVLQRKCACGGEPGLSGQCAECQEREGKLQRRAADTGGPATAPPIVHDVLRSPGQPLDGATRAFMEPRFGHDFSKVRVHADAKAAVSAGAINAAAYTLGRDIVFGAGKYQPKTNSGKKLLAHELTHSVQQDAAKSNTDMKIARQEADKELSNTGAATTAAAADTAATTAVIPEAEKTEDSDAACALTTYTGSNLVGEAVVADVEFTDSLDTINTHASDNDVNLHVTSSFRTSTDVPGAVVTPAKMSNHLAGHAIDMNVKYGEAKDKWCNSTCLGGVLPDGVSGFIKAIQDDAGLRWGGDFSDKDPVHIDDNLNADGEAWKERKKATQAARTSGCG